MGRWDIDRRTFLRGVLGGAAVTVGLPMLDLFYDPPLSAGGGRARAACELSTFPKRFGWWFWGNGVIPSQWIPPATGPDWHTSLGSIENPQLAALANDEVLRSKLSVISGLAVRTPNTDPHGSGPAGFFVGDNLTAQTDGVARTGTVIGPSVDQIIASIIASDPSAPPRSSIQLGVQRSSNGLSYSGPNALNPPTTSPIDAYLALFGPDSGFQPPGSSTTPDPRIALRLGVLSAVRDRVNTLHGRLGVADRARLERHLDGIARIEHRLSAPPPDYPACDYPAMPDGSYPDIEGRPQMSLVNEVMSEILAMSLACDITRVFSMMFTQPVNNTLFGAHTSGHHQLTHDEADPQPEVNDIVGSIVGDLAVFLRALDAVPEDVDGTGKTLLDHTVVLCTTDVSLGRTHAIDEYPIILAGSCHETFKMGEHIRYPGGENATKLTLSMIRAFDPSVASFGRNEGFVTDTLPEILVSCG